MKIGDKKVKNLIIMNLNQIIPVRMKNNNSEEDKRVLNQTRDIEIFKIFWTSYFKNNKTENELIKVFPVMLLKRKPIYNKWFLVGIKLNR